MDGEKQLTADHPQVTTTVPDTTPRTPRRRRPAAGSSTIDSDAPDPTTTRRRLLRRLLSVPLLGSILVAALVLLIWQFVLARGVVPGIPAQYISSPSQIASALVELSRDGFRGTSLAVEVAVSLRRTLIGFAFALVIGVPAGLVIGSNRILDRVFVPLIGFLRPIPALAFIPLVVLWFGLGETSIIIPIFTTSFLFIITGAYVGARSIPTDYLLVARNYRLGYWTRMRKVVLPSSLPQVLSGVRTGLMVAWAVLVAAELIGATQGLGFLVQNAAQAFLIPEVYVGILFIGLVGVAFELSVGAVERKLLHWTKGSR